MATVIFPNLTSCTSDSYKISEMAIQHLPVMPFQVDLAI